MVHAMSRPRSFVVPLVLALVLVAGCTEESEGTAPAPTPASTSTDTPPQPPPSETVPTDAPLDPDGAAILRVGTRSVRRALTRLLARPPRCDDGLDVRCTRLFDVVNDQLSALSVAAENLLDSGEGTDCSAALGTAGVRFRDGSDAVAALVAGDRLPADYRIVLRSVRRDVVRVGADVGFSCS